MPLKLPYEGSQLYGKSALESRKCGGRERAEAGTQVNRGTGRGGVREAGEERRGGGKVW